MRVEPHVLEQIETIENIVCTHFGVTEQQVINKGRMEDVVFTRAFLFYILHFKLEMSPLDISRIYSRTPRNIKKMYAKIKHGLKYQKLYNTMYEDLMKKIEPILPKDLEKFWNRE